MRRKNIRHAHRGDAVDAPDSGTAAGLVGSSNAPTNAAAEQGSADCSTSTLSLDSQGQVRERRLHVDESPAEPPVLPPSGVGGAESAAQIASSRVA